MIYFSTSSRGTKVHVLFSFLFEVFFCFSCFRPKLSVFFFENEYKKEIERKQFAPQNYFYSIDLAFASEEINSFFDTKRSFLSGKQLFAIHCLACHQGGNNIIIPEKNLRPETLEANGMKNNVAISYQIQNGKNGMPAFGGRLTDIEIEKIANYVLQMF